MTATAIVMMVVSMLILWGGLALAIWHLGKSTPSASEVHRDL